ncbi:hypothetical protein UGMREWDR_CDS0204 [Aeromonas phage GomatiRiver_11]|nr:hypothetical protein OBDJBBDK_00202 [Aeromonas phage AhFM11]WKW84371.1 hypothetical protein UGMREWDR_CDS0204 [Aeromonas phage GomatiRiver_11]
MMYVEKRSGKPFKGGSLVELVIENVESPYTGKPAYLLRDGSIVEIRMLKEVK